jgi:hypothetical protein
MTLHERAASQPPRRPHLPAGDFVRWLRQARLALERKVDVDVPCDDCVACCTSSHFVHIGPAERQTLAAIPARLLFPAPGLPGTLLLGYDKHGRCPLLGARGCTIYSDRPLTCRTYDCRVFAAAGVAPEAGDVRARVRRWRFSYATPGDRGVHTAVEAAARYLRRHGGRLLGDATPLSATHVAILALEVCDLFLEDADPTGENGRAASDARLHAAVAAAEAKLAAGR